MQQDAVIKKTDLKSCPATCHAGAKKERSYSSYTFFMSAQGRE